MRTLIILLSIPHQGPFFNSSFLLQEEREKGFFDDSGNYVEKEDKDAEEEAKDAWLQSDEGGWAGGCVAGVGGFCGGWVGGRGGGWVHGGCFAGRVGCVVGGWEAARQRKSVKTPG